MAEKLTPQQKMAVEDRGGKLLVSAAAGSGKTKVLVDRLLKYVMDPVDPANIDDFLIITYTKAAAAELRSKIAAKLSERIAEMPGNRHLQRQIQRLYLTKISTVHAFCSDILREYAYMLDISADFRVGDENECLQLRQTAMDEILDDAYSNMADNPDFQVFVDTQGLGRSDMLVRQIVEQVYDSARCHLDPDAWCRSCIANNDTAGLTSPEQTVWGRYLMDDLMAYLDHQIAAMERCVAAVAELPGLEKPAALLGDTVFQLRQLRGCATWDAVVAHRHIDYGRLTFPKKFDDPAVSTPVKAVRSACKDGLERKLRHFVDDSAVILADMEQTAAAARGLMRLVSAFSEAYGAKKKKRKLLDFSDLEHLTLDLLLGKQRSGITAAARQIAGRFREIMVDEYQDSNQVQDAIFGSLTEKKQNLFMVGDVKQSIYQFRLADPEIFLDKYAAYLPAEEAEPGQGRKIMLSSNFRSGPGVIKAVNDVFYDCMSVDVGGLDYGEAEALQEGIPHIPMDEPEIELHCLEVQEDTYAEEAAFVADRICELLDGTHHVRSGESLRPMKAEDIVILLRSPGSVGADFQDALEQRGIRCASSGGADLLLSEEVGTLHAFLQVLSNPRQDIPLLAVLVSPVFGFTAQELAQMRAEHKKCPFYDALRNASLPKAQSFMTLLDRLQREVAMCDLAQLFERIFNLTGFDLIYSAMDGGKLRKENLETFYRLAVDFTNGGSGTLDRFLKHLDMLSEKGIPGASDNGQTDCVTIMSIHKSKGLEFPVVFLCGLSKRFNQDSIRAQVLCHKQLGIGLSCVDTQNRVRYPTLSKNAIAARMTAEAISEEMRILYVAMTRPKDRLIMTYASNNLENKLAELAARMAYSDRYLLTAEVATPGEWILYSALGRTEAGQLHNLAGMTVPSVVRENPWKIDIVSAPELETEPEIFDTEQEASDTELDHSALAAVLDFSYPYEPATVAPSKQTATQLKGRLKDQEASENTVETNRPPRVWRDAAFTADKKDPTAFGNAMHLLMQYVRFDRCENAEQICQQIDEFVSQGVLTPQQAQILDPHAIAALFRTETGRKLVDAGEVLREFKFSILDDASGYGPGLENERILLQGVVDCAIVEDDGITVIDFKTDFVTEQTVEQVAMRYKLQVNTYANAVGRIFEKKILGKALYFFRLNRFIWL